MTARELIAILALEPLANEGGYFRQTWRSETASAILYLMTDTEFSALHRLTFDEIWHFHLGDPVEHVTLTPGGAPQVALLGPNLAAGQTPQLVVPRGCWQGARLSRRPAASERCGYALLGCTVSPPWDPRGFELGSRLRLHGEFPGAAEWIAALTR